jgi:YHS domain-containing protein
MKTRLLIAMICAVALSATLSLTAEDKEDPLAGIKCPISGKAIKAASFLKHNGGKVYFCCDNCPKAFAKNTAKFTAKANQQLYATKQAKLVKCPIKGKKINEATTIDVAGTKVAFCCNGCKGKVSKATGADQLELVFGKDAFAKGFKVASAEK